MKQDLRIDGKVYLSGKGYFHVEIEVDGQVERTLGPFTTKDDAFRNMKRVIDAAIDSAGVHRITEGVWKPSTH